MALGTIRGAQLALGKNGRVHVVWDGLGSGVTREQRDHPLYYTRLNNSGTGFEPERNVITSAYGLDGGSSVAADAEGRVYVVWHAPTPGNTNPEPARAVFVARSTDEGQSFSRETPALSQPTGACPCCGLRAFADSSGRVSILFRAEADSTNRDETLLWSRNYGKDFEIAYSHSWSVGTCPMSSASLADSANGLLAAAETHGRVFFIRLDPRTGKTSSPVSPETPAKHPVAVANRQGDVLLVWAEGTGWNKGGAVAWQIFDSAGRPKSPAARKPGLPAWSFATTLPLADGNFEIIY
jgi:hypothetical protein